MKIRHDDNEILEQLILTKDFRGVDLSHADWPVGLATLKKANFNGAGLRAVGFLSDSDFRGADFSGANLRYSVLDGSDFRGANFEGADLRGTSLDRVNFKGANLTGTILDPNAVIKPLLDWRLAGFDLDGDKVYGWRTRYTQYFGDTEYVPGKCYKAPYFSVDTGADCHPGIYFATGEWMSTHYLGAPLVKCYALRSEIVKAGDKFRAKRLWIVES